MSEREDVEALAAIMTEADCGSTEYPFSDESRARAVLDSGWLAAHVEAVRVSERVRLAGEVEALADAYARMAEHRDTHAATRPVLREVADNIRALVPVPGVRLTEEA
jgi:hypothetical protein